MTWLYNFIGDMLSAFSTLFGGKYVFALLLYALIFKVLFLPFGIKQQKSQIKMARLAPKIELIKAKYKGRTDAPTMQKMRNEIMELQSKEGYSPLSGCLPLLLQFPIIIFLYNVIRNPLTYICRISDASVVKLGKICGIADPMNNQITLASAINAKGGAAATEFAGKEFAGLADLPDFTLFGLNLGETPSSFATWLLVLIPFIAAALTWLSMVLSRKWNGNANPMAQQQDAQSALSFKIMDLLMPGMTLAFAFGFSGMMGIYWIYQSALGILQTFILSKAMPLPKYTEAELKAMRKAQKEAEKAQRAALKAAPKFRSLHYIDEDDYDELPQVKSEGAKKKDSQGSIDAPEIKD